MSFPGTPMVRVGYMTPNLPYPVSIYLPPTTGTDARTEIRTRGPHLDIAVPTSPLRHEALGRFMDAWSQLEDSLTRLLTALITIDDTTAGLIAPKLGTKNTLDLLEGLGMRKLDNQSSKSLTALMDRVRKLNTKRNVLVHGHWVLEANVILKRGDAHLVTQFLREVSPDDPQAAEAMTNPRNQKERVRYAFTIKRIEAASRDTDAINTDICNFLDTMRPRNRSMAEISQLLLDKRPYQVTYSSPTGRLAQHQANPATLRGLEPIVLPKGRS